MPQARGQPPAQECRRKEGGNVTQQQSSPDVGAQWSAESRPDPQATKILVWDLPLRIFHWSLAGAVALAVVTGKLGGTWMTLHGQAGLAIVGLVVFRLAWGVVGTTHARFSTFAPTPAKIRAYLRGHWQGAGHNPLGALSVFALLAALGLQAGSGLFSNDDIAFSGPLYAAVSEAVAGRLTAVHRLSSYVLIALVVLHVVAIAFYVRVKRDNLVKPMLTGWKQVAFGESSSQGGVLALVTAVLLATAAVYGVSTVLPASHAAATVASRAPSW
jgi:cytochrome b